MQNNVCYDIMVTYFYMFEQNINIFKIYIQNIWTQWGDDIIISLMCIFISTVQEMLCEKLKNFFFPSIIHSSFFKYLLFLLN